MKEKHLYRTLLWAVSVLGVLCFIFGNSLTPASESAEESRGVFSVLLSVFPFITHHIVRKLAHVAEYALLGVHLSFAPMLFSRRASVPLVLLFGVFVALADEGKRTAGGVRKYDGYCSLYPKKESGRPAGVVCHAGRR